MEENYFEFGLESCSLVYFGFVYRSVTMCRGVSSFAICNCLGSEK